MVLIFGYLKTTVPFKSHSNTLHRWLIDYSVYHYRLTSYLRMRTSVTKKEDNINKNSIEDNLTLETGPLSNVRYIFPLQLFNSKCRYLFIYLFSNIINLLAFFLETSRKYLSIIIAHVLMIILYFVFYI